MLVKPIIYQVLPRLFGNMNSVLIPGSSFKQNGCGKLNDFTDKILSEIKSLGCTHIWFTGVIRHATKTSFSDFGLKANHPSIVKGEAGSPYSITDYYDIAPSISSNPLNRIKEFEELVQRCKKLSLKVIIDFVPNHLSREYQSILKPNTVEDFGSRDKTDYPFHPMNNFYYIPESRFKSPVNVAGQEPFIEEPAKVTGNDCVSAEPGIHDWYETVKLNYGVDIFSDNTKHFDTIPDTWYKMKNVLEYWLDKGVSGFRCDMAEMVPAEFWEWAISSLKSKYQEAIFIGEVYNPALYGLFLEKCKFDYLYDKVGLYDTLKAVTEGKKGCNDISRCWQSLGFMENKMLNFIENHDEVRAASSFYAGDPFKALPAFMVSLLLNRCPYLLYFGQELGEKGEDSEGFSGYDGRTSIFDYWSVESVRKWLNGSFSPEIREYYTLLLKLANSEEAFSTGDKFDLHYSNKGTPGYNYFSDFAFARKGGKSLFILYADFTISEKDVFIKIPSEMFKYFQISEDNTYEITDILTGSKSTTVLNSREPIQLGKLKNGLKIAKLSLQ